MLGGHEFAVERQHVQVARGLADLLLAGDDHVVKHVDKSRHFQFCAGVAGLRVAQQRHDNAGFLQFFDHFQSPRVQADHTGAALPERPCGFLSGLRQCQQTFRLIAAIHEQRSVYRQYVELVPPIANDGMIRLMRYFARLKFFKTLTQRLDRIVLRAQFACGVIQGLPGRVALFVGTYVDKRSIQIEEHNLIFRGMRHVFHNRSSRRHRRRFTGGGYCHFATAAIANQ